MNIESPEVLFSVSPDDAEQSSGFMPDVAERMRSVYASASFLPVTIEETHRAVNLLHGKYAAVHHIHEVGMHQNKAQEARQLAQERGAVTGELEYLDAEPIDPNQAMIRVLSTFGRFAISARSNAFMLKRLKTDVSGVPRLNRTVHEQIGNIQKGTEISEDSPYGFAFGLPEFIRHRDLRTYAFTGGRPEDVEFMKPVLDADGYVLGDSYTTTPNNPIIKNYIARILESMRLREIRDDIDETITEQQKREQFWTNNLVLISKHSSNKQIAIVARKILTSIDIANKAKA